MNNVKNLQRLHDKVSKKFNPLFERRDEVQKKALELTDELQKAEENYDIEKVEKITAALTSTKRIFDRINKDIEELKVKYCGENGSKLNKKLARATSADHQAESENSRRLFEKYHEYSRALQKVNTEIRERSASSYVDREEMIRKFKPFMPKGVDPRAINLSNLSDVTEKNK